jgi:phosphohistidine phosphatase
MMELLLIRHGLAGKQNPDRYPNDDLRPLTSKGRKLCKRAIKGLTELGIKPKLILSSPALRCVETAKIVAREFDLDSKKTLLIPSLHHKVPVPTALAKLAKLKLPSSVILVGHEPWIGEMISLLIAGNLKAGIDITKGGAAFLAVERLKPGQSRMRWLMTQNQLAGFSPP